jgi:hypothetical protein
MEGIIGLGKIKGHLVIGQEFFNNFTLNGFSIYSHIGASEARSLATIVYYDSSEGSCRRNTDMGVFLCIYKIRYTLPDISTLFSAFNI